MCSGWCNNWVTRQHARCNNKNPQRHFNNSRARTPESKQRLPQLSWGHSVRSATFFSICCSSGEFLLDSLTAIITVMLFIDSFADCYTSRDSAYDVTLVEGRPGVYRSSRKQNTLYHNSVKHLWKYSPECVYNVSKTVCTPRTWQAGVPVCVWWRWSYSAALKGFRRQDNWPRWCPSNLPEQRAATKSFILISRCRWAGLSTIKQHTAFWNPHNCFPIRQKRNTDYTKNTDTKPNIHTAEFVGDVWTFKWQCFVSTHPQELEANAVHDRSPSLPPPLSLSLYWLLNLHEKSFVKGKAIPGQDLRVPEGWGSQISWRSRNEGGTVVSHTHRPPLPARKYSWHSFLLTGWVDPRAIVRPEGL